MSLTSKFIHRPVMAMVLSIVFVTVVLGIPPSQPAFLVELALFIAAAAVVTWLSSVIVHLQQRSHDSEGEALRRADDARALSDELNLLIDSAEGYAIYMLDPQGNVTIWNKGAERLKGWREDEVVGQPSALFYPADAVEAGKPVADLVLRSTDAARLAEACEALKALLKL